LGRHIVAEAGEIQPGGRKIVDVEGRSIGVFNVAGDYLAVRNRCPHQGGPLCLGTLVGAVDSPEPGVYRHSRPGEMIRCPWHAWEFDLRDGRSWFDPRKKRVASYEVAVVGGAELAEAAPPRPGMVPGPYQLEMYSVAVERQYVVVDLPG
jgi:nitrite reductase/ring-hydroxylating ferredoxin subunit